MTTLSVLFFAAAREIVGSKQASFTLPSTPSPTVSTLVQHIVTVHPRLSSLLPSMLLAVNLEYVGVDSDLVVGEKDEIAFIPPLAAG
jgi:molybdopterin converting factor small subunit